MFPYFLREKDGCQPFDLLRYYFFIVTNRNRNHDRLLKDGIISCSVRQDNGSAAECVSAAVEYAVFKKLVRHWSIANRGSRFVTKFHLLAHSIQCTQHSVHAAFNQFSLTFRMPPLIMNAKHISFLITNIRHIIYMAESNKLIHFRFPVCNSEFLCF